MYSENTAGKALDWDSDIQNDGEEFILLTEGDYNFQVVEFTRGSFPGSTKIAPCPKATIMVEVDSPDGKARVRFDLILSSVMEWKLSSFFRCIGQKQRGERLKMDWNKVVGSVGRAHFKTRKYQNKDGEEREANDVDRFYDYDPKDHPEQQDWVKNAPVETAEPSWKNGGF